jgi:hypothetical protein
MTALPSFPRRAPIPAPEADEEARQLVAWLCDAGNDARVCDRLDQAVEDLAADADPDALAAAWLRTDHAEIRAHAEARTEAYYDASFRDALIALRSAVRYSRARFWLWENVARTGTAALNRHGWRLPRRARTALAGLAWCVAGKVECDERPFLCAGCGHDVAAMGELGYMVRDEVWQSATAADDENGHLWLCIGCLEGRLRRTLCRDDLWLFGLGHKSDRLIDRKTRAAS